MVVLIMSAPIKQDVNNFIESAGASTSMVAQISNSSTVSSLEIYPVPNPKKNKSFRALHVKVNMVCVWFYHSVFGYMSCIDNNS